VINSRAHFFGDRAACIPEKSYNIVSKFSGSLEVSVVSDIFVHDFSKSLYRIQVRTVRWKKM
jgi:hypothetical protein